MTDKAALFALAWRIEAPATAPDCVPEYRFSTTRKHRFDFAFPAQRLAVEINGGRWKAGGGRHNSPSDYEKVRLSAIAGWRIMPFLTEEIENDPAGCVAMVCRALGIEMPISQD